MVTAAIAVFATAFVGGTLHAPLSSDPMRMAAMDRPLMIHESGVARFVTTDTGVARAITTNNSRSPLQRLMLKLGIGSDQPYVLTDETVNSVQELGTATVSTHKDENHTQTIQPPSEGVFELRNE